MSHIYICIYKEKESERERDLHMIYDIIYNHCMTADISTFEKRNLKNICTGIQQINKGLTQYNDKGLDSILISTLLGYLLKITRNYFHD